MEGNESDIGALDSTWALMFLNPDFDTISAAAKPFAATAGYRRNW
jgi:hypothetical protein